MRYAVRVGSIPMMDILIQKGVGKALLQVSIQPTYVPETKRIVLSVMGSLHSHTNTVYFDSFYFIVFVRTV